MYFGKPVVATAFSGNMEYMTPDTALLVDYRLIPVKEGQYPHASGQVWADPAVDQAASHMVKLLDDPDAGRQLGARTPARAQLRARPRRPIPRWPRRWSASTPPASSP
jgi:hypothetical protein